jgi:DegV family protein with EDD domain
MRRPTVLVVDGQEPRRKELVRGLAEHAYEVIAAAGAKEGRRFAAGLKPEVIVIEAGLWVAAGPWSAEGPLPTTIALHEDEPNFELPEHVFSVATGALGPGDLLRRVRTVLVGRELGLATDPHVASLRGDLHELPLLELLPMLQRAVVTGRVVVGGGEMLLEDGEVVAAHAGTVSGVKAFARLGRTAGGSFRVILTQPGADRQIYKDLLTLMAMTMEDQHRYHEALGQLPSLSSRVRVVMGPAFFSTHFSASQQRLLQGAHEGGTVWSILDAIEANDGDVLADLARLKELGVAEFHEPQVSVRIVTDSAADLPPELARRHHVHVIPLSVAFGKKTYKDGVDLTAREFYRRLEARKSELPRTVPPSEGEFLAEFRLTLARNDVVSVHVSGHLSETLANARAAAEAGRGEFARLRGEGAPLLEVVDSMQVSAGLALLVMLGARMAERGLGAKEVRDRLEAMRPRVHLLFVADTIEYLARGGGIGKAQAWLGGRLGIKPILTVSDGTVVPLGRVRGRNAAHRRLVELLEERVEAGRPVVLGIAHARAPVQAVRLRSLLQDTFKAAEILETEIGPVVGAHVGPGCVGAAIFQPGKDEQRLVAPVTDAF